MEMSYTLIKTPIQTMVQSDGRIHKYVKIIEKNKLICDKCFSLLIIS